jgi:hypothetical protein
MRDFIGNAGEILGLKARWQPPLTGEMDVLETSRFAIASAASLCDLAYEFLSAKEQQQATDLMRTFNDATDSLLLQIVANP